MKVLALLAAFAAVFTSSWVVEGSLTGEETTDHDSQRSLLSSWQSGKSKIIVFGDSNADVGRRYNADTSFNFEGIGLFPWEKLYKSPTSDSLRNAYTPSPGSATNGKVWPDVLGIPQNYNFATSAGSASSQFRSAQDCKGYTGDTDNPTGTFDEQIDRYIADIVEDESEDTLDYPHIVILGSNDLEGAGAAARRYLTADALAENIPAFANYSDTVDRNLCLDNDGNPTFTPMIEIAAAALAAGVRKLQGIGVTGRILVANLPSSRGIPAFIATGQAEALDLVSEGMKLALAASFLFEDDQVRELDFYQLFGNLVDKPEVFTAEGFTVLSSPCLVLDFFVDSDAEVMGTQALRPEACQGSCALCANGVTPCQQCFEGNPSVTKCKNKREHVFYDDKHPSRAFHKKFARAIYQCTKDSPNMEKPFVAYLCPQP